MKHLTNRQKQSIETKLKITEAAIELFQKNGFENVTIKDICDTTNMSIGAFYHHFSSKTDIINTGYKQIDLLVEEELKNKVFSSNYERILTLVTTGCDILENLGWIFVSDVYRTLLGIDNKYTFAPERYITTEIHDAINKGILDNELYADIDTKELTNTILRVSRGVVFNWCLTQGTTNLKSSMIFDLKLILNNYISTEKSSLV